MNRNTNIHVSPRVVLEISPVRIHSNSRASHVESLMRWLRLSRAGDGTHSHSSESGSGFGLGPAASSPSPSQGRAGGVTDDGAWIAGASSEITVPEVAPLSVRELVGSALAICVPVGHGGSSLVEIKPGPEHESRAGRLPPLVASDSKPKALVAVRFIGS